MKYKYLQKVRVIEGFYRDHSALITDYAPAEKRSPIQEVYYFLKFKDGTEVFVRESYLQEITK